MGNTHRTDYLKKEFYEVYSIRYLLIVMKQVFYFKLDGLLGQYLFMNFSWYIGLDRRNEYPIEYSLESHGNIIIQSFI